MRSKPSSRRVRALLVFSAPALAGLGCGGAEAPLTGPPEPIAVQATPRGGDFDAPVSVVLESSRPGEIYYAMGGASPLDEGTLYEGPVEVDEPTLLSFIAVSEDGVWSKPASELYTYRTERSPASKATRLLLFGSTGLFFTAFHDEERVERTFDVHSVGVEPVTIHRMFIGEGNGGFYQRGIFVLESEWPDDLVLDPGEKIRLTVSYQPTSTLRTAAVVLETDGMRVEDGLHVIPLTGRINDW